MYRMSNILLVSITVLIKIHTTQSSSSLQSVSSNVHHFTTTCHKYVCTFSGIIPVAVNSCDLGALYSKKLQALPNGRYYLQPPVTRFFMVIHELIMNIKGRCIFLYLYSDVTVYFTFRVKHLSDIIYLPHKTEK